MNILALNWNDLKNPYAGGAEVHLEELLRRLVKRGHQVTLFCSGFENCKTEEVIEGVRIIRRGSRATFNLTAPFTLRKLVREQRYDLLVEDINKIPFYTPLYLSLPTLVVVPHLFATTVFQEINPILGSYIYLAEQPLVPLYRRFHFNVISDSTAEDLVARGLSREQISVVHCGIDRTRYAYRQEFTKYDSPTLLYLGRLKKYKCVQHLIEATARVAHTLPNVRLVIVGSGDYLPTLRDTARRFGIEELVTFTGYVTSEEKVERLSRSHVAVLPSLKEGWGLTNIEANAVGTAVVAADSPGLRDSVKNGESGLLYEHGNIAYLTEKLTRLLTDSEYRARIEAGGRAWADQFNWDTAAEAFEAIINRVTRQSS